MDSRRDRDRLEHDEPLVCPWSVSRHLAGPRRGGLCPICRHPAKKLIAATATTWLRLTTSAVVLLLVVRPLLRRHNWDDWVVALLSGVSQDP